MATQNTTTVNDTPLLIPVGTEFSVNADASNYKYESAVTALTDGGFVVTWTSQDESGLGVYAQRYDVSGNTVGSEFRVNTYTPNNQYESRVTALADGGFVVVWNSTHQDGSLFGNNGQRYDAAGNAVGAEFQINTYTVGSQLIPDVTALADGGFVVAWTSLGQDGSSYGIYGQRYNVSGNTVGSEFRINTYTANIQYEPIVTGLTDGGFVVTWSSYEQDKSGNGVYAKRYDASGNAVGGEFRVNTYTTGNQSLPVITALAAGGFVVTWSSYAQDGSGLGIYGKRYNASGSVVTGEFRINSYTLGDQYESAVTALTDGGFVVTWTSEAQDGSGSGIYGQQYDASGNTVGSEFRINTDTAGNQSDSAVTALADGGFVVTWSTYNINGISDIHAQRFGRSPFGIISLDANSYTVAEEGSITLTLNRTGGSTGEVSVTLMFSDGTATAPADYDNTPILVTFADGQISQTVTFVPVDDLIYDSGEFLNLTLANPTGGATLSHQNTATLTIVDTSSADIVPLPSITLALSTERVSENGALNLVYTLTRTGNTDNSLTVEFAVGGDAAFTTDYTQTGATTFTDTVGTIVFAAGSNTATLIVNPKGDNVVEADEVVSLSLTANSSYTINTVNPVTGTIANDDGGNGDDILTGSIGNDTLNGGTGNDTMTGLAGNDAYIVDSLGDVIIENPGEGIDTVNASVSYTLANHLENLTLTTKSHINGTGNTENNTLKGNNGNNILTGLEGNDPLLGGNGNDILVGGIGNDSLTGGKGLDNFVFNNLGEGIDKISDFTVFDDTIVVSASGFGGALTADTTLLDSQFIIGSSAIDENTRFIYDATTGGLFFDNDGTGVTSALQIATLSQNLLLTAADIYAIA